MINVIFHDIFHDLVLSLKIIIFISIFSDSILFSSNNEWLLDCPSEHSPLWYFLKLVPVHEQCCHQATEKDDVIGF